MGGGRQPPRPRVTIELRASGAPAGEHVVRQVFRGRNSVAEWSLKSGPKFDKEFIEREIGRTAFLLFDVPGFAQARSPEFVIGWDMPPLTID